MREMREQTDKENNHTQCSMPYAPCPMPHAQFPIPNYI
ncbi:hypothetical protein COO91_03822 [Nostoc flagelliforme CCNUN1]|uniref:CheY chemotaxis protein or a CheY-like REC n=1 Tax=Nostoc flagelliforme CCNUN1 TaxID=2038116 RepID=A0A2K8SR94_9NOSO|nr:hypothetical protein COO91_03822 [Nostoc flagelliforme CCNUN1]